MTIWQAITWDIARAGGFTAYILLALAVALGLALSMKLQSPSKWPRIINSELHNFLTLLALIFTGIHILAVWIDPFTRFGWSEVFIPFVSHYRTLWMALGIISLYLGLAIGLSTWLRPFIGYKWWRRLHYLTLGSYLLVTVHGIMTGSDTQTLWGLAIYAGSIVLIGTLFCRRVILASRQRKQPHAVPAARNAAPRPQMPQAVQSRPKQAAPTWSNQAGNFYEEDTHKIPLYRKPPERAVR